MKAKAKVKGKHSRPVHAAVWDFRLYVADKTSRSLQAFKNLTALCDKEFPGHYRIEVVDVVARPQFARTDNIVALPTLLRMKPGPVRRVIGDLSDRDRLLSAFDVQPTAS